MRYYGSARLYWVWAVFATCWAPMAVAQQFYVDDKPVYFDETCLEGEIPEWFRDMHGTTYDEMCLPNGICGAQDSQTRAVEFQTYCQGNLILRCLEADDSNKCLVPLIERLRSDASRHAFEIGRRIAENDLSTLPKLLKRRLESPGLLTAGTTCVPENTLKYFEETYDVARDLYCVVDGVSDLRVSLMNHHFTLDRYGIPR